MIGVAAQEAFTQRLEARKITPKTFVGPWIVVLTVKEESHEEI
jgi:hypothetical protein